MAVINTNISSIQAQNSLRLSQLNQSTAMERLSSGVRINNAKDDAAGLAISTRMTSTIRGLAAAVRNANDGISLTQTAEGSLGQISDNLQRIRELAVQASNTGNNASDRNAMNNEAKQLVAEIDRVASNTTFNNINLLDGTFTNQDLQVGAGNTANDRLSISIGNAKSSTLGVGASSSYSASKVGSGNVTTAALAAGDLSINGFQVGASVSDGVSFANASASGIAKAAAINAVSGQTGVSASVSATTHTLVVAGVFTATVATDLLINGVDIGAMGEATGPVDRGTQTAAAVNAKSSQTGVTATADSAGVVTLTAADGRNISVTGTSNGMSKTGLGNLASIASTAVTTAGSGSATEVSTVTVARALTKGESLTVGGLTFTAKEASVSIANVAAAFANLANGATTGAGTAFGTYSGALAAFTTGAGSSTTIVATSVTPSSNVTDLAIATNTGNYSSALTLSSSSQAGITMGGTSGLGAVNLSVTAVAATATAGAGVSSLDLTTAAGAQLALATLDKAINTITDSRASMGAYQNRLAASVSNLETYSQNLQSSRSRILDTDYAKETTNLAKSQIIAQAATAMLAQANQSQQGVLALLK
jgi:flagellin